jgi:hypothetical protein
MGSWQVTQAAAVHHVNLSQKSEVHKRKIKRGTTSTGRDRLGERIVVIGTEDATAIEGARDPAREMKSVTSTREGRSLEIGGTVTNQNQTIKTSRKLITTHLLMTIMTVKNRR